MRLAGDLAREPTGGSVRSGRWLSAVGGSTRPVARPFRRLPAGACRPVPVGRAGAAPSARHGMSRRDRESSPTPGIATETGGEAFCLAGVPPFRPSSAVSERMQCLERVAVHRIGCRASSELSWLVWDACRAVHPMRCVTGTRAADRQRGIHPSRRNSPGTELAPRAGGARPEPGERTETEEPARNRRSAPRRRFLAEIMEPYRDAVRRHPSPR